MCKYFLSFFENLRTFASMLKKIFLSVFGMLLLSSCGGNKQFSVDVDIPSVGTQEMIVVYMTEGGERVVMRLPAIDGKFEFSGESMDTTSVEIFNAKKSLFATFPAVNGMKLRLKSEGDSLIIEGADVAVRNVLDTFIVDELPLFRELELVVAYDSVASFKPEGVWFFTSSAMERGASVMDSIRKYSWIDTLEVRDVYVSGDMSRWRMLTARDSATWIQGLLPDAPIALKGILTSTPCMVMVDSSGVVERVQRLE